MGDVYDGLHYAVHLATGIPAAFPDRISRPVEYLLDALVSNELRSTERWQEWQGEEKGPPANHQYGGVPPNQGRGARNSCFGQKRQQAAQQKGVQSKSKMYCLMTVVFEHWCYILATN